MVSSIIQNKVYGLLWIQVFQYRDHSANEPVEVQIALHIPLIIARAVRPEDEFTRKRALHSVFQCGLRSLSSAITRVEWSFVPIKCVQENQTAPWISVAAFDISVLPPDPRLRLLLVHLYPAFIGENQRTFSALDSFQDVKQVGDIFFHPVLNVWCPLTQGIRFRSGIDESPTGKDFVNVAHLQPIIWIFAP
eukprot:gb/GECG01005722.1/.p1 GENE.gb/GECG01005722.1/~~gb/GECG01005722.1/.p1  ORF type:complete len:192 (+),score=8.28 gb/GECG01005722.1/:1-576(+)